MEKVIVTFENNVLSVSREQESSKDTLFLPFKFELSSPIVKGIQTVDMDVNELIYFHSHARSTFDSGRDFETHLIQNEDLVHLHFFIKNIDNSILQIMMTQNDRAVKLSMEISLNKEEVNRLIEIFNPN